MPRPEGRKNAMTQRQRHNTAQCFRSMAMRLNRYASTGEAKRLGVEMAVLEAEKHLRHAVYTVERGKDVIL